MAQATRKRTKTWLSSQCCTNQRQKAWLYPQESDKRWAKEMCTTCEIQGSRTWLHPFKAMEQRPAPNQDMQATCVHTERSDRIVSSSCIVLARSQIRLCPVVNFGDQQTYQRDTVAARNRHTSARWRRARRRTHLVPAAATGWQSWRLRQKNGRRKSGSKTLKGCHCWDPTIVFWWFGAWAASNTRTLQGGCTPFFHMKPLNKDRFQLDTDSENFVFCHCVKETGMQAKYVKAKCFGGSQGDQESDVSNYWQPPYNPTSKFQGSRVTVHGATRHTSASLLLSNKHSDEKGPSEHVILEIQHRSDARVFWKHYYHAEEEQVEAAWEYRAAPSLFTKGLPEALPTEAAVPKNWCARSA